MLENWNRSHWQPGTSPSPKSDEMVAKCANPSCTKGFRYLRGGKLFVFAPKSPGVAPGGDFHEQGWDTECFWLCERCALTMTIIFDKCRKPSKDDESHISSHIVTRNCSVHLCLDPLAEMPHG